MKYIEKMSASDLYNKIITTVNNASYTLNFLNIFNSFMNKYKNDPKVFIDELTKYLLKIISEELHDYGNDIPDEKYLVLADYPEDLIHIQKDFANYGFIISAEEADIIWGVRSDNWCAQWLGIGDTADTFIDLINFGLICTF